MSSSTIVFVTLIAYKIALLAVGFWASKRVSSEKDFFLAGQGLGAWTAGLSYAASTSSAWVLLGYTGFVFAAGLKALWLIPGIFSGYFFTWYILGPKLNDETRERGHITIVDFMVSDLDEKWQKAVSVAAALMIIFCFVFYVAAQFQAAGNAFTSVFNMGSLESIVLGAVIIVVYCLLGGFWAASVTDALQAMVMMLACILVPIVTVSAAGGFENIAVILQSQEAPEYFKLGGGMAAMLSIGAAMGLMGIGLGAMGQPQLLNRIMAAKDHKTRRQGALITVGWGVIVYIGVTCLAFSCRVLMPEAPSEELFFLAAEQYLSPVIAGIVIAAILSAVMSTVDSLLLASASAVSHDLNLAKFTPGRELLTGRLAMVGIAVLAVIMTLYIPDSIFDRALFSWVALGAAFGPITLVRCLGWSIKGGYVFSAVLIGFLIAVVFSNISGVPADFIEKWVSWTLGLVILSLGREKRVKTLSV